MVSVNDGCKQACAYSRTDNGLHIQHLDSMPRGKYVYNELMKVYIQQSFSMNICKGRDGPLWGEMDSGPSRPKLGGPSRPKHWYLNSDCSLLYVHNQSGVPVVFLKLQLLSS